MRTQTLRSVAWRCEHGEHVHEEGTTGLHPACQCPQEPTGVKHMTWLRALAENPDSDPVAIGYAHRLTLDGFDYESGRQERPKSPKYLAEKWGSESQWKLRLKGLRESGWLTPYAEVWLGPGKSPTPLHLLTVPEREPEPVSVPNAEPVAADPWADHV